MCVSVCLKHSLFQTCCAMYELPLHKIWPCPTFVKLGKRIRHLCCHSNHQLSFGFTEIWTHPDRKPHYENITGKILLWEECFLSEPSCWDFDWDDIHCRCLWIQYNPLFPRLQHGTFQLVTMFWLTGRDSKGADVHPASQPFSPSDSATEETEIKWFIFYFYTT